MSVANSEIHKRARGIYFWGPVCAERTPGAWACTRARVQCAGELGGARLRSRACAFVSVCVCREPGCVLTRSRLRLELSCRAGENEGRQVRGLQTAEGERGVIRLGGVSLFFPLRPEASQTSLQGGKCLGSLWRQ